MSSYKIGMNLRVTENGNQGGRKYMEDTQAIRFVKNDEGGFEFAYFGIFDGHGGGEASKFAKQYLLDEITKYDCFWSEDDEDIMWAIRAGFLDTHFAMWKEVGKADFQCFLYQYDMNEPTSNLEGVSLSAFSHSLQPIVVLISYVICICR